MIATQNWQFIQKRARIYLPTGIIHYNQVTCGQYFQYFASKNESSLMKKISLVVVSMVCAYASLYSKGEQTISKLHAKSLVGGAEEVISNSCCANDSVCDTADLACSGHTKKVCEHDSVESWASHAVNNLRKCNAAGTNFGKTCTQDWNSEYCGESYACTYSLVFGKCVNTGAAQTHNVPTTCSSPGCP